MKKKSILLLFIFNFLLLSAGWIMAFYAYPRLPQKMPLWLDIFGQQTDITNKSPLFFIYPVAQTLFVALFLIVANIVYARRKIYWKAHILKEVGLLALIFFNLIFIHIQRSVILSAHHVEEGVHKFYFYSLFVIILGLIPYYRMRVKLCERQERGQ